MSDAKPFFSPVGELQWVFITGKGKNDLNGNPRFVASIILPTDSEACKDFITEIESYWDENKPKGTKKPKSLGFKHLEDDNQELTGFTSFNFWTGISYQDGNEKVIPVSNAKGAEIALGEKKIGNGSRGRIAGAMDIYDQGSAVTRGVTLYLNGIQLTKFVEYKGGVDFDSVEDDEAGDDAFEGFDDEMPPVVEDEEQTEKPRL